MSAYWVPIFTYMERERRPCLMFGDCDGSCDRNVQRFQRAGWFETVEEAVAEAEERDATMRDWYPSVTGKSEWSIHEWYPRDDPNQYVLETSIAAYDLENGGHHWLLSDEERGIVRDDERLKLSI